MRVVCPLLCGFLLAAGCGTPRPEPTASADASEEAEPVLDRLIQGRVVDVNMPLRYVVIDFAMRGLPEPGRRLDLYRGETKVGSVRISGPAIDTTTAGDILSGEAQVGDQVLEAGEH